MEIIKKKKKKKKKHGNGFSSNRCEHKPCRAKAINPPLSGTPVPQIIDNTWSWKRLRMDYAFSEWWFPSTMVFPIMGILHVYFRI
jgi:hypothetical protein